MGGGHESSIRFLDVGVSRCCFPAQPSDCLVQRPVFVSRCCFSSTCRQTKEMVAEYNQKYTKILLRTKRPQLRKLVGLITGHNTLNKHLFTIGGTDSPIRACMEAEETTKHILLDCKQVEVYRTKHLGTPGTLHEAAGKPKALLGFVEQLGWMEYCYPRKTQNRHTGCRFAVKRPV